jgi:putative ATP-dependent endonuclease of the OLD family
MKLHRITVKNFRGLSGDQNIIGFDNSDIIFLIGQNNVGKSTFLRAYEYFVASKQAVNRFDFYNHDEQNTIEIIAEFVQEEEDREDPELSGSGKSKDPDWINKWVDPSTRIVKIKKQWVRVGESAQKYTYNPQSKEWTEGGFGGFDSLLTKYAPEPISIAAMETETTLEEKVNKIINDKFLKQAQERFPTEYNKALNSIKELQQAILNTDDIASYNEEINKCFKQIFPHLILQIQSKQDELNPLDVIKKNHSVAVKMENSEREESFTQQGHGVIRQALFNFLSFLGRVNNDNMQKKYLLLFEEPELFLHPKITYKLRKSLYELAQSDLYQVICATHSSLMIDVSKPHSSLVRVTKDVSGYTKTHQVGDDVFQKDEYKSTVQMINRFNSNICECFYAEQVILVEGDTETIVLRDLLDRIYEDQDVFVLNTGSKNNIPFFQEVLTHFRIKHFIVHDSDHEEKKSAWTLNGRIWDKVEFANSLESDLARRYVFTNNFEYAHNYKHNPKEGKPLSAFNFSKNHINSKRDDYECIKYLNDILGEKTLLHDQSYLKSLDLKKGEDNGEE